LKALGEGSIAVALSAEASFGSTQPPSWSQGDPPKSEMNGATAPRSIWMLIATWKIMVRRAHPAGYHYVSQRIKEDARRVWGKQIELAVEGRRLKWTVAEISKDHSARAGIDVFTVRVDETEGKVDDASAKLAGDSL
jgi:hypothetical protein